VDGSKPVTLAVNGEPTICLSANLTVIVYSPGEVWRKEIFLRFFFRFVRFTG
jgi:hypothetical protein